MLLKHEPPTTSHPFIIYTALTFKGQHTERNREEARTFSHNGAAHPYHTHTQGGDDSIRCHGVAFNSDLRMGGRHATKGT